MPPIPYVLGIIGLFIGCVILVRADELRDFSRHFLLTIGATAIGVFGGLHANQAVSETASRARALVLLSRTEVRLEILEAELRVLSNAPRAPMGTYAYLEHIHNPLTRLFQDEEFERLLPRSVVSDQLFYESEFIRLHLLGLQRELSEDTLNELRDCVLLSRALVSIAEDIVDEQEIIWEKPFLEALANQGRSAAIQVAREQETTQLKFRQMIEKTLNELDG